jgi:CheY-like chemotaxis protein
MTSDPVEILLVEDDPSQAELAVRALRKHNISNHIRVVEDGAGAVEFLFPEDTRHLVTPRMILLNLGLPKIDGIEVLRRIKGHPRTRNIPVIIMTVSRKASDLQACLELGANSFIIKPVDFQQFADAVRSLDLQWVLLSHLPN